MRKKLRPRNRALSKQVALFPDLVSDKVVVENASPVTKNFFMSKMLKNENFRVSKNTSEEDRRKLWEGSEGLL